MVAPCRPSFDKMLVERHGVVGRYVMRYLHFLQLKYLVDNYMKLASIIGFFFIFYISPNALSQTCTDLQNIKRYSMHLTPEQYTATLERWISHSQGSRDTSVITADIYSALAITKEHLGDSLNANKYYAKAVSRQTSVPLAYYRVATNYFRIKDYSKIIPVLSHAIRLKPDYIPAWILLSETYKEIPDTVKYQSAILRTAYLGVKQYREQLDKSGHQLSIRSTFEIWNLLEKEALVFSTEQAKSVEDSMGLLKTPFCPDSYPVDPPSFVPVEEQPVPLKMTTAFNQVTGQVKSPEDTVWVRMLISEQGLVQKAFVALSDDESLNQVACTAARTWMFIPASLNKTPKAVWVAVPFRFKKSSIDLKN